MSRRPVAKRPSQAQTLRGLANRGDFSSEGRRLKADIQAYQDEVYGGVEAVPQIQHRGSVDRARYDKPPKYSTMAVNQAGYRRGPSDEQGRVFDGSHRNILCMDVRGDEAVMGSADHGLKVFNIANGKEKRTLYNKRNGHTEWVTSCAYLNDGRVISAGMDSKLCLWQGVRCDDLLGHTGSISQVDVNDNNVAISCGYDRTLRIWDLNMKSQVLGLPGHTQPVMQFSWVGTSLVSGDRGGSTMLWDVAAGACVGQLTKGSSRTTGQVGALGFLNDDDCTLVMVGDQSGTLSVFDIREGSGKPCFTSQLHPGGVICDAKGVETLGMIVTAGADKVINVLDPRNAFQPVYTYRDHSDFIYSLQVVDTFIVSGGGNGWVLVHEIGDEKCLYGLGANQAAVRCICPTEKRIVAAGDDGTAIVYDLAC